MATTAAPPCLLLTGGNGFLGEATIRQWGNRGKIFVLVRDGKSDCAVERFKPVADRLKDDGVVVDYEVLSCNLLDSDLGLKASSLAKVLSEVTHVVSCASNVQFDLSPEDAIENNVKTAICVARFASRCKLLKSHGGRLVHVSTAYVSPPQPNGGLELPTSESAMKLGYQATKEHHHNTYTWSKCIAEHEVVSISRESDISLSIVRPSIIGPAWSSPFPGWCPGRSSPSQMALMMYTSGILRAIDARGAINIIPVDWVANMVIDALVEEENENEPTFYTATVPQSHAAPIAEAMSKGSDYYGYTEHTVAVSNARPDFQYRAMSVFPARGLLGKMLEFVFEDSHAIMLQAIGQQKAAKLFGAALAARDTVIKPYASATYDFKPSCEHLNLWPREPSEFFSRYLENCMDSCQSSMRKYRHPRPGNWITLLVSFSLLTFGAIVCWVASKGFSFMVEAYKEEQSSFDLSKGPANFQWSPFGGKLGGMTYGPLTAAALGLATPVLYAFLLWVTTKLRPDSPSPSMPKWRFWHNLILTVFSGWVVLATLLEMYRASDTDESLVCMNINTPRYDFIQAAWVASKAYEWIDTVFLLLQHKRPIVLHLWHHCSTVAFFSLASPYDFASKWGIIFNGTIHFFMYAHYARPFPRWLRPYITRFQILQFVSAMLLAVQASRTCDIYKPFSEVCFHVIVGSYLVLFVNFYVTDKKRREMRKRAMHPNPKEKMPSNNAQVLSKPKSV